MGHFVVAGPLLMVECRAELERGDLGWRGVPFPFGVS